MPQSLAQVWLHVVFSTKNRAPYLEKPNFRDQMFKLLAHHVKEFVHMLVGLSRTLQISKLIEVVKTETSKWAKRATVGNRSFAWQSGYGVFSVSYPNLDAVKQYVENQDEHHAKRDF